MDVVVEVAGGTAMEPILTAALAAGKPVVTANKALLASKLAELGVLAQRTATPLYCEAAAAAALPIIRHLSHRADEIDSLAGILNGTCNFVMTRLEQAELSLDEAVAEAQALGFAEADPSADLDGPDAAAKLSILAYRAFGAWVRPDGFLVRGIRELGPADCDLAESMGCRIRLIARAARIDGALDMAVEPLLLPSWHLLASVEEEYNAVYLRCASSGDLSLFGKGAGALPTATAVLGDLIDLAQDNSVRWPVPQALPVAAPGAAVRPAPRRHYLRVTGEPHPGPRAAHREPGAPRRADRAEPRHPQRSRTRAPRLHALAEPGCADGRRARGGRAAGPRRPRACASECSSERRPTLWLDPAGCPGRAAAARRDGRGDAPPPRGARRARAAHRARLPPPRRAHRAARSLRLGARHRVAGGQGRVPVRQRGRWSDLPHLYARYGTTATAALIGRLKALEAAGAVLVCDSGMQATALVFDVLMTPGAHAVLMRQVYNKTQDLPHLAGRARRRRGHDRRRRRPRGAGRGDPARDARSSSPRRSPTRWCAPRTSTALVAASSRGARARRPELRLVVDSTIATPWAFTTPLLRSGRRRRARQRHQGARRHRPRPVGLRRHARHRARQRR